mmetsp:Transcript_5533/g.22765  ORF Transcript_5533/g.22765 Transcript_5533/m.22765 type:complete len:81 (+) Transcript_5533:1749-1991(+)
MHRSVFPTNRITSFNRASQGDGVCFRYHVSHYCFFFGTDRNICKTFYCRNHIYIAKIWSIFWGKHGNYIIRFRVLNRKHP